MIRVKDGAVLDEKQRKVIYDILPYATGYTLTITRGHSSALEQLNLIERYANECNCIFSEFESGNLYGRVGIWHDGVETMVYRWQRSWSALLNLYSTSGGIKGKLINPPYTAKCLEDYFAHGQNMKGQYISASPHIISDAIDFSQMIDGRPDIDAVHDLLVTAKVAGVGIKNITVERANGCVHIDLA